MPEDPEANGAFRTEDAGDDVDYSVLDRADEGLGPFLLVRASAIMNAWVHMQCALWSPEVAPTPPAHPASESPFFATEN